MQAQKKGVAIHINNERCQVQAQVGAVNCRDLLISEEPAMFVRQRCSCDCMWPALLDWLLRALCSHLPEGMYATSQNCDQQFLGPNGDVMIRLQAAWQEP